MEPRRETICFLSSVSTYIELFECKLFLPDMVGDNLPMLWIGMDQNVLDQVIAVLIASNYEKLAVGHCSQMGYLLSMSGMRGRS